jgi:hypothetical protein
VWKRSLVRLSLELLLWGFSRLRGKPSTASQPVAPSNPKAIHPDVIDLGGLEPPIDVRVFSQTSWTFPTQFNTGQGNFVNVSTQGTWMIYHRLLQGDLSLCEAFGIAPGSFASTLRNAETPSVLDGAGLARRYLAMHSQAINSLPGG